MGRFKIVSDSAMDLTKKMRDELNVNLVSFKILLGEKEFIDDDNLDINKYLEEMINTKGKITTACPSPGDYLKFYGEEGDVFVVTISSKLSGSYNSAILAKDRALDKNPKRNIYVFDSETAMAGQTNVVLELIENIKSEKTFEDIIKDVENYINKMTTFVVLETLEVLRNNGRISKIQEFAANLLNLKLVLIEKSGEITEYKKVRGLKNAYRELIKAVGKMSNFDPKNRLIISHVRNEKQALKLKKDLEESFDMEHIEILQSNGLSSTYAADKGISLSF